MPLPKLPLRQTLDSLPPPWPHDPLPDLRESIVRSGEKLVILDDDPTGAQTVHSVSVLADWSVDTLVAELENDLRATFVLTNSRSLPAAQAEAVSAQVGANLAEAVRRTGKKVVVVSRGDSTLRGHYPGEVNALARALGQASATHVIVPFFLEGGRYTIEDIHYVAEGDWLTPAGQTEFARDTTFGYQSSNLRDWVAEKSGGAISAGDVASITIDDIRTGGPDRVATRLKEIAGAPACIVNAASMRDLEVFALGVTIAEHAGGSFVFRTAASFVKARAGIGSRDLLTRETLDLADHGAALIVVGSHVAKTSSQLAELLKLDGVHGIEVDAAVLVDNHGRSREIARVAEAAGRSLAAGVDTVLYTSRNVITGQGKDGSLSISKRVSAGMVEIVGAIDVAPRYIIAKGGITSCDIAIEALGVRRAMALGQALPGVPVWRLGAESRYPGIAFVVFPGNVGTPDAIATLVAKLRPPARQAP